MPDPDVRSTPSEQQTVPDQHGYVCIKCGLDVESVHRAERDPSFLVGVVTVRNRTIEQQKDEIERLRAAVDKLGEKVAPIQGWVDGLPADSDGVKQVSRNLSGILVAQVMQHFPPTRRTT